MSNSSIYKVIERFKDHPEFQKMAEKYHHIHAMHNTKAASEIVPVVMELFQPDSVIDVGCGLGTWLKVFRQEGAGLIKGIEGEHLKKKKLAIDPEHVIIRDLEQPFSLDQKFDMAVCLEVAEHLQPASADSFVSSLCQLSDAILFSAAVPFQGGLNHVNEQWVEYWQEKFDVHGYEFIDMLRPKFWNNPNIEWWYRQNIFLVLKKGKYPFKQETPILNLVHPEAFMHYRSMQEDQSNQAAH